MNGLVRLFFAGSGCVLRGLATVPIGCGGALLKGAAACERRAKPPER